MALRTGWELTFEPYPFSSLGLFWPGVAALLLTVPLGLSFDGIAGLRQWMARRCQKTWIWGLGKTNPPDVPGKDSPGAEG